MVTSSSKRDRGGDEPPAGVKRAHTSLDQEESKSNASESVQHVSYERLKNVSFPDEISALPHVLSLLDTLLMTPEEALSEAIKTNHLKWVQEILDRFPCDFIGAMTEAAGLNRPDVVNLIIRDIFTGSGASSMAIDEIGIRFDGDIMLEIMVKGALAGARNGHVAIVKRLLPMVVDQARNSTNYLLYWFDEVQKIMDEGVVHGQLPVVEFMVEHASTDHYGDRYLRWTADDTLAKAILAGHADVAEYLVNQRHISWNLKNAFIAALDKGQISLAERIRELYPEQMRDQNLFINVACSGDLNAVEYLYNNGCNDSELVGLAFTYAASEARNEVVEFLVGTGCVSSKAFEKAFKRACSGYKPECIDTVTFLYKLNRAPPQCIDCAFGLANSIVVVKFLFENEKISEKAITAAFENAVRLYYKEHPDILLFLYKQPCIPSNLIDKAFLHSVKSLNARHLGDKAKPTKTQVVTCLRDDERLSSKTMGEAFVDAVKRCKTDMMTLLYVEKRTPPEFLVKAFVEAAHRKQTGLVTDILKLLSVEEHVPRKFMHETFVEAARHGQMSILELVCQFFPVDLPLEVLKNALDVAGGNHKIGNLIRKMEYIVFVSDIGVSCEESFAVYMKYFMKHKDASTVKSIQEVEFAVLSSITVREEYKAKLCVLLSILSPHSKLPEQWRSKKIVPKSQQNRAKRAPEYEEGKEIHALGDLLLLVRAASVDVVENIQKWREIVHQRIPRPYIYENVNYLLVMCEDLNFLDQIAGLVEWLGFRLLRNPFIVDRSLDDIISSQLAVNVQDSRSLKYWGSASWHQNNKLASNEKAPKAAVSKSHWKVLPPPQPLTKPLASIGPEDDVVDGSRIASAQEILLDEESFHGRLLALKAAQEYVDRGPSRFKLENGDNNAELSAVYDAIAMLNLQLKTAEYRSSLLRRESAQVKLTLQDLGNQVCWITLCRESDRTKDHRVWKCRDIYRQEALKLHSKLVEKLKHCLGELEGHETHIEGESDKSKSRLSVLKVEKKKQRVARLNNKKEEELARHDRSRKKTTYLRSKARPKEKNPQKRRLSPEIGAGNSKESNNIYADVAADIEMDIHVITRKSTSPQNGESPETIALQLEEKRQRSIYQKRARIEQQSRLAKDNELGLDRRRAENVAMKAEDALSRLVEGEIKRKSQLKTRKERMEREASCAVFKCTHEMNGKRFVISVYVRNAHGYDLEGLRIIAYDPRSSSSFTMTMTLREFNSLAYGRTSGGLGAFCKWLCLLYEKRRRQFRLVWSGAPCPPPLRVRENDQALICVHKEGLRMRNVRSGGYCLVAVYIRADNPSVVSFVMGSWTKQGFLLTEHGVEARCLVLGSDLDVQWGSSGHATIVWTHQADHWINGDTKSPNMGQRIYSSEIVVNQLRYFLHLHDTNECAYTVNFVPKPKKGVSTQEETDSGANTLVLSKRKVNPYNVHLSSSNFADFISLTSFEHIPAKSEKWKATVSPKWTGKLAKYVRVLRLARYACKINGLFCFVAIFIVQQKTEFRAHLLLEITWLSLTLPSSFSLNGAPTRQSLRIALSDYLRCGNASRRFAARLRYDEIEGEEECPSCLAYTMTRAKLYENDIAVPDGTFDYSLSCSNCALIQYRRLHALQELIIHRTIVPELLELIYHGHCDVCANLVPPIVLVLGSSAVYLPLLEHYFASFDCSKNGFLHFSEGHSIAEEGLHVRDSVLHTLARDQVVVLFNADFGMTVASANIFANELHWWLYPDHHDLPCHVAYIVGHNTVSTDERDVGCRDFDLIEALRALNLAACRISELEPVHLDYGEEEDDHASAFDAYLVAEAVLIEATRVLLHPEYKWQKPREIIGASSWSSACSFLLDPVQLSGHLQHCNVLKLSTATGVILDAYFAHANWPHDYPQVRPYFYGLLDFMLHVQHVRHILEMKCGSLQGSPVRRLEDGESAEHEQLAKNTSVINCSQLDATEIFL